MVLIPYIMQYILVAYLFYNYQMGPHIGKLSESSKVTELASGKR